MSWSNLKATPADDFGNLFVNSGDRTEFGEQKVLTQEPGFNTYSPYGMINNQTYTTTVASGGTVTANTSGSEIDINTSTTLNSSAELSSKRVLKYTPGFENVTRFSAKFNTGIANSLQYAGIGNIGSNVYFAYSGTDFVVRRSTNGLSHVVTLTLSAAETASETITINLNSVEFTISATNAGGSIPFTAHEIEVGTTWTGWFVEQIGNDIVFQSTTPGPKTGTYSISSTGAADGTFATSKTGVDLTTTDVAQADWNGTSVMKNDLDPTQYNVYEIEYIWFGFGNILFKVLNPLTAKFETMHTMTFSNAATSPSLSQPNMFLKMGVLSDGSTTAMTLCTASQSGGTYGLKNLTRQPHWGISNSKALSGETVILAVKNRHTINAYSNQSEITIRSISAAADGNQPVTVKVVKNPTSISADSTTDFTNWQFIDENNALGLYDTTTDTYSGGITLYEFVLGKNLADVYNVELVLFRDETVVITCTSTQANTPFISISMIDNL